MYLSIILYMFVLLCKLKLKNGIGKKRSTHRQCFFCMWNLGNQTENAKVYTSFPEPNGKQEMTGLLAFETIDSSSRNLRDKNND